MNKYIKGAIVFTGGVVSGCILCGSLIVSWSNSREYEVKDVLFETRIEAENTLDTLKEVINTYGYASVSDLYDLADVNSCTYLDNKHGWTNLDKAKVVRLRNGYTLDLPTPLPID